MDQVLDRVELPLSGVGAELVGTPLGVLRWRLTSDDATAGGEVPDDRTPILGWRRGTTTVAGRRRPVVYTAAWGSLLGGCGPLRVVAVRRRRFRSARRAVLAPFILGEAFWIAEAEGAFDRLVVSDGSLVESRDLRSASRGGLWSNRPAPR
jgi:hypothetical protein